VYCAPSALASLKAFKAQLDPPKPAEVRAAGDPDVAHRHIDLEHPYWDKDLNESIRQIGEQNERMGDIWAQNALRQTNDMNRAMRTSQPPFQA
jgi:hypothetical protein